MIWLDVFTRVAKFWSTPASYIHFSSWPLSVLNVSVISMCSDVHADVIYQEAMRNIQDENTNVNTKSDSCQRGSKPNRGTRFYRWCDYRDEFWGVGGYNLCSHSAKCHKAHKMALHSADG